MTPSIDLGQDIRSPSIMETSHSKWLPGPVYRRNFKCTDPLVLVQPRFNPMDSKKSPTIFLNEVSHEQIELSSLETQRRQQDTQSNASITTEPSPSVNIQELPPVDKGWQAWSFCFAGVVLEALVWGFSFRSVIFLTLLNELMRKHFVFGSSYGIFQGRSCSWVYIHAAVGSDLS